LSGQARRGKTHRTSSGPKGSSDKETFLGAAGILPGYFFAPLKIKAASEQISLTLLLFSNHS